MLRGFIPRLVMAMVVSVTAGAAHAADDAHAQWNQIERYCFDCHNTTDWAGGVAFDSMSFDNLGGDAKVWEAAARRLRNGIMSPPSARSHPDQQTVNNLVSFLETRLDAAQVTPAPGRVPLQLAKADTRIVPANGHVISGRDIQRQHAMFAALHEQMVAWQNKGWDSGDCIAARPLKDFEAQYGDPAPFIHGAFLSLNLAYSPD